jgi:hypothetical protein
MASAVQFVGVDDTIEGYERWGVPCWGCFQERALVLSGDTKEDLEDYLQALSKNPTDIPYVLRSYADKTCEDFIDWKTPYCYQFKFGLTRNERGAVGSAGIAPRYAGIADPITARIHGVVSDRLGKMVDRILNGEDEQEAEKPEGIMGFLQPYIDSPEKLVATIGAIKNLFSSVPAMPIMQQQPIPQMLPAAIGTTAQRVGVAPAEKPKQGLSPVERLSIAIDRLEKCDPEIVVHIEQLATLAETKPDTYKMALNFLK